MVDKKRYVGVKKSSLEGLGEEWGAECYAYYVPANYEDNMAVLDMDTNTMSKQEQVKFQIEFVRAHFVSGKIKVFDGQSFELIDMRLDDATATVGIADRLYADIMGFDLDPKELRKAAGEASLQNSDVESIETISSEDSVAESPIL
jgi:hypothetical protein